MLQTTTLTKFNAILHTTTQQLKPALQEVQDKRKLRIWSSQDFYSPHTGLCNPLHSAARSGVSRSFFWPLYQNQIVSNWWVNIYIDLSVGKTRQINTDLLKKDREGESLGPVSRKSRNFSGAFRVTFSLYLQNEARNLAVTLIFIPFTTYEKDQLYRITGSEFYEWLFGTFEKRALENHKINSHMVLNWARNPQAIKFRTWTFLICQKWPAGAASSQMERVGFSNWELFLAKLTMFWKDDQFGNTKLCNFDRTDALHPRAGRSGRPNLTNAKRPKTEKPVKFRRQH